MIVYYLNRHAKELLGRAKKLISIAENKQIPVFALQNGVNAARDKINNFQSYVDKSVFNLVKSYIPFTRAFRLRLAVGSCLSLLSTRLYNFNQYLKTPVKDNEKFQSNVKTAIDNLTFKSKVIRKADRKPPVVINPRDMECCQSPIKQPNKKLPEAPAKVVSVLYGKNANSCRLL